MKELFTLQNIIKFIKKIGPIIGIILLLFLIYSIGVDKIIGTFMKISPIYIIPAILLVIPALLIKNYQWRLILKKQNINISWKKSLKLALIGRFYKTVTPAGVGAYLKLLHLKDEVKQPMGKLFANHMIFGKIGIIPFYILIIIGALFLFDKVPELLPVALIIFAISTLPCLFFIKKERGEKICNFLIRLFIPKKRRSTFEKFANTFYNDFPKISWLLIPLLVSIPVILINLTRVYLIALAVGIEIPFLLFILIFPISSIAGFLPIGNMSVRGVLLIFLFSFYGVPAETIVVVQLANYIINTLIGGSYGIVLAVPKMKRVALSLKAKEIRFPLKNNQ
jgi:uncharacterized protein (TIRG00374 family)